MSEKTILLIDDNHDLTKLVKLNVEKLSGYKVTVENDARKAMFTIRRIMPDLILLDVGMPYVDGGEIAHRIKNCRDIADIPLVFFTGLLDQDEVHARGGVISNYLCVSKSIGIKALLRYIDKNIFKTGPRFSPANLCERG